MSFTLKGSLAVSNHLKGVAEGEADFAVLEFPEIGAVWFEDIGPGFKEGEIAFVEMDKVESGLGEGVEDFAAGVLPRVCGGRAGVGIMQKGHMKKGQTFYYI